MKKVKIIFPDGSTGEVDEKDLQAALDSGAKLASEVAVKKTTVKFADGSETDIEDSKLNEAVKAGAKVVKKKEPAVASATGSVEVGSPLDLENTSTPEKGLDVNAITSYAKGLNDPAQNLAQPTKEQIALQISKQRPLLQTNKDGSKAKTKDEGIAETAEKIQAERNSVIKKIQEDMSLGKATKEQVAKLYDYPEAKPFLQSYLNAFADKEQLPATGDILAPGEHWDSAWKNMTAENRPLAVQKMDADIKYSDSLINTFNGSVIKYVDNASFAGTDFSNDKNSEETIAGVDVNNSAALVELRKKLQSPIVDIKDASGKSIPKEKREELLAVIDYKIKAIERDKPLAEELKDQEFSDKLYYAIGEIEHGLNEITTNNLTQQESNTDERKYSAIVRGLNYFKSVDPGLYTNVIRAVKNEKEIAQGDYQQLLSKGQELQNENIFIKGAEDKNFIGAETAFNLDTRSSLVAKRSGALGETAKKMGLKNTMSFSDWEIDLLNKKTDWAAYGMRPPTEKELDLIKTNEGKWFYDQIPKTGALSAVAKGVQQPFLAIARSVEDVTTSSASDVYLRSKQLDRQTSGEQLTPDETGKYGSGLASDRGNTWYTILEGAGSFLPQILLTRGLGAPISGATRIAATSLPRAALTAEQVFTVNTTAGTVLSSYLQGYGDSYERALQETGDPVKAEIIGNIGGTIDGIMEQWLPETRIGQGILRNLKGNISERIAAVVRKGGDLNSVLESTKGILKPFVSQYLNVTGQEMAEEGAAVLLKQMAETIVSPRTAMDNDVAGDLGQVLLSTALQTFVPAVASGASSSKNRFTKQVFNEAASKFDYTKDALSKALNIGSISQDEYNKSLSLLKTHQNSLVETPKINAVGAPINSQDRNEYAYQETLIKINNDKASKATDVEKELLDKKINESKEIQRSILMPGEKPRIKTTGNVVDVLTDDENAAISAVVEKDLKGTGLEIQATVLADEKSTVEQKKAALKEISDQLLAPATAETIGAVLGGKASNAVDNLMYEAPVESEGVQAASVQQPLTNPALIKQAELVEKQEESVSVPETTNEGVSSVELKAIKIGEFEKDEMSSMIDIRKDTVDEDPESAFGIEAEEGALDKLKQKIDAGDNNFTTGELEWLKSEATDLLEKTQGAIESDGNPEAKKRLPKIKKFVSDIEQALSAPLQEAALTEAEQSEWNNLSMEEKRRLAQENLPAIDNLTNVDVIKEADSNAKILLDKLKEQAPVVAENIVEEEVTDVQEFSDRIATGEQMSSAEDLQFYENNREAIEAELKRKFAETTVPELKEDATPEERKKISDAFFAFADKILKADITGSGGGAALSNIFAIPQQVLGRSIQVVALAIKAGESIASAINKGIQSLKDEGYTVSEKQFTGFANSIIAGEKPRVRSTGRVVDKTDYSGSATPKSKRPQNLLSRKSIPITEETAEYLSKSTLEVSGEQITQPFEYSKTELDLMAASGQDWIVEAKKKYNANAAEYAVEMLKDAKSKTVSLPVKTVAMVSLLNSVDNDLQFKNLTAGERDILKSVRADLETTIAEFAREGSLTLNAMRLIHKLYKGRYNLSDTMAGVVTKPVQAKTDDVTEQMRQPDEEISEVAREQKRKESKEPPTQEPPKSKKKPKEKKADAFKNARANQSDSVIAKLKQDIIDLSKNLKGC